MKQLQCNDVFLYLSLTNCTADTERTRIYNKDILGFWLLYKYICAKILNLISVHVWGAAPMQSLNTQLWHRGLYFWSIFFLESWYGPLSHRCSKKHKPINAQAQTQDETHHLFLRKDTLAKDCVIQGNCFVHNMETRQGEYMDYPIIYIKCTLHANQNIYLGSPCPN